MKAGNFKVRKSFRSLTGKLLLTIGTLMVVWSTVFWYLLIRHQERELLNNTVKDGFIFVDFVQRSTRYGMLTFQELRIKETIESIGTAEEVMKIRILDNKGRIAYSSEKTEIGKVIDKSSPLCVRCHSGAPANGKWNIRKENDLRILNIVEPIYNESACYTSTCHVHSENEKVLGIVEADLTLEALDANIVRQEIAITVYVFSFLFVFSFVLCAILWKFVSTPVTLLTRGMELVAGGNLDHRVNIVSRDEMGDLARAFNAMTSDLKKAKNELIEWGNTLERKVQDNTEAIKRAQAQLVHSEKLASLGRMAAGVAHEINSPLTGIVTFGHLLRHRFSEGSPEREDIDVIIEQANRCSNIIKGLLGFARASAAEKSPNNINDVIVSSLNIVRNKADFFNIKLITDLDETLPKVVADASQLQQVFLNMIVNAGDSMEGKGTITVMTRTVSLDEKRHVEIEFKDTGPGISDEDLPKLFEPFFTTKPVGKGTGLGLAVSHGIIQDHGGTISVKTKLGEGTSFFIRLPAHGGEV